MERRAACCYLCYWLHLSIYLYLQTADIMVVVDDGDWRWTLVLAEVLKYLHSYLKENMLKWYYLSIMV